MCIKNSIIHYRKSPLYYIYNTKTLRKNDRKNVKNRHKKQQNRYNIAIPGQLKQLLFYVDKSTLDNLFDLNAINSMSIS